MYSIDSDGINVNSLLNLAEISSFIGRFPFSSSLVFAWAITKVLSSIADK